MTLRPFLLALVSAALFGAATPLSKYLLMDLGPFQLSGLLYLGAAVGVLPATLRRRPIQPPWQMDVPTRRRLLGAICFGGIVGPVLLLFGLRLAAATSVALWLNLEAVATAVLGVWFFRDHLGRNSWIGAAGILVGALVLSWGQGAAGWQAGLLVAAACLCWGFDNHLTALIDGITPAQSTLWKGLAAGSVNLAVGLAVEPFGIGLTVGVAALVVGVFAYGVSIVLYITAAQQLGATRSQLIFSTAPYFAIVLSVMWLGETISPAQIAAAVLVGASVVLLTVEWHSHDHAHVALDHEHWHDHADEHHVHQHTDAPGSSNPTPHTHRHQHTPLHHAHHHWPDLHHRHEHE
ncbi:DMT family transporter [Caldilinea sp.]|uniref:DMT family transporter n=1 Tax=Caldilinea sp. TaxID=2293560 RepID=UPI002BCADC0A|nr:DMT family transporter [Anaerolineales bacterium]HQY92282.1 DMT family transporter [Caldilinea sp.]